MSKFSEILARLPAIDHIDRLALHPCDGSDTVEIIENRIGKAGSVAVYYALLQQFGTLNSAAAKRGLELYAEHVADAEANPGKHPNIDRLFRLIDEGGEMKIEIIER